MKRITNYILVAVVALGMLQACSLIGGQLIRENDQVYGTARLKLALDYPFASETFSPLRSANQTIIKEGLGTAHPSYAVYDIVELKKESFELEDRVFLIADKQVFRMQIESMENFRLREPRTADASRGRDSSRVHNQSVYSTDYFKQTRFVYHWSDQMVAAINSATEVYIRYYAGPDMITLHVDKYKLKKLRMMIQQTN